MRGMQCVVFPGVRAFRWPVIRGTNGQCNGGFIRDDAYLLIVIVSNSDDSTFTRPPAWIEDTAAHRPADSMAIAAITGGAPKISEYVAGFPQTLTADVNTANYTDTMTDAAGLVIDSFCQ